MSEVKTYTCERVNGNIAQGANLALFTVSDYIRVHSLTGVVTGTAMGGVANNAKVLANPTTGADVDLCVALETNADVVGTIYSVTGTLGDAMIATTSGAVTSQAGAITVAPGTIDMHCVNSTTGKVAWTLVWSPINASASVVAA